MLALPPSTLPADDPVRTIALLHLALIDKRTGHAGEADARLAGAGMTTDQCSLLDVQPVARNMSISSDAFPTEAQRWGFEGTVREAFDINADGSVGERNAIHCGGLEHKMGIHGNATCQMILDGAVGSLVGEPHKGLQAMFVMMNAARLGVGLQGLGVAEVAYQNAVAYARERRQGRALTGPAEPAEKADPLFVHPDVRRMLMTAKALTEGLRALCLWGALQVDLEHLATDEDQRRTAATLPALEASVKELEEVKKVIEVGFLSLA